MTWEPGMVVFHIQSGRPYKTGRVAKVYKNGNCILEGDEHRRQYRQCSGRWSGAGGWNSERIEPWSQRRADEYRLIVKREKVRQIFDRLKDLDESALDAILNALPADSGDVIEGEVGR